MAYAVELGTLVNVFLGVFLLAFGLLVALTSRDRAARRWLACYLVIVGAHYFADALRGVGFPGSEGLVLTSIPFLANNVDPVILLLFAAALRHGRAPRALAAVALAVAGTRAGLSLFLPEPHAWRAWLDATYAPYVLVCYLGAFALLVERWLQGPPERRAGLQVLVVAFAPVCLSRLGLAYVDHRLVGQGWDARAQPHTLVMDAALVLAFGAFAFAALRLAPPGERPLARQAVLAVGGLLLTLELVWALRFVPIIEWTVFPLFYSARWLLFFAVVARTLPQREVFGVPPTAGSPTRFLFHALLGLGAAAVTASLVAAVVEMPPMPAFLLGMGTVGLGLVATAALRFALPAAPGEMDDRRMAAYRARLLLGAGEDDLAALERRLGLTPAEARRARDLVALEREVAPPSVAPGVVLAGRYEVGEVVGAGTFGRVFAARDRTDEASVVVKELRPEWASDPDALVRFRREAEALLDVSHPNLVAARALEPVAGGGHVLVLERVEGESLAARLRRGPLAPREARRLAEDLLAGLDALHRRGLLHRDVKPANVMLRPDGRAVLLDLGSAGGSGTRPAGGHPGSTGYESPEQARGEALGPQSDLYAVGVVLWEALSGRMPPGGQVPGAWRAPLLRALERDPARRFPVAQDLLAALPRT